MPIDHITHRAQKREIFPTSHFCLSNQPKIIIGTDKMPTERIRLINTQINLKAGKWFPFLHRDVKRVANEYSHLPAGMFPITQSLIVAWQRPIHLGYE